MGLTETVIDLSSASFKTIILKTESPKSVYYSRRSYKTIEQVSVVFLLVLRLNP